MNKGLMIGGVLLTVGLLYLLFKKSSTSSVSATGPYPINTLPARAYALNGNFNPQGQPPPATFAPFSGVPFIEGLLSTNQGNTPDIQPSAFPDLSGVAAAATAPAFSGSGGSGFGGAGTDVGPATIAGYS
jgi:hypothetical protein